MKKRLKKIAEKLGFKKISTKEPLIYPAILLNHAKDISAALRVMEEFCKDDTPLFPVITKIDVSAMAKDSADIIIALVNELERRYK